MSRTAGGYHPPAIAGLSRGRLQRQECGPAKKSGEVCDCGIIGKKCRSVPRKRAEYRQNRLKSKKSGGIIWRFRIIPLFLQSGILLLRNQ